jgi:hypothetical protein
MEDTKTVPVGNSADLKLKVTVALSPALQQKLIEINTPLFAAIDVLKELGLLDAAANVAAGKPLIAQTLNISPVAAGQLCQMLSRVSSSDPIATESVPLVNSIPTSMRRFRPSIARPLPAPVVSPMHAPQPVAQPAAAPTPVAKPAVAVKPAAAKHTPKAK